MSRRHAMACRTRDSLSAWLDSMNDDVRRLASRPALLHIAAAELEISQLEVRCSYDFLTIEITYGQVCSIRKTYLL